MINFDDPRTLGLFTLASGLLSAAGPRPFPISTGQAFGDSALRSLDVMQKAKRNQIEMQEAGQLRALREAQIGKYNADLEAERRQQQQFGQFQGLLGGLNQADLSAYGGPNMSPAMPTPMVPSQSPTMEQNLLGPWASPKPNATDYQLLNTGAGTAPKVEVDVGKEPWVVLNAQADYLENKTSGITDPVVQQRVQTAIKALRDRADRLEGKGQEKPVEGMPYALRDPKTGKVRIDKDLYQQWLTSRKEIAEAGASNLNLYAPQPGVDPQGNAVFFQPDKKGGAPKIVPGIAPKAPEAFNKQVAGVDNVVNAMDFYKNTLTEIGGRIDRLTPSKRLELGTAYNNMMLQAKEAYALGVLNGPDYSILQQVIKNPLDPSSLIFSADDLKKQVDTFNEVMSRVKQSIEKSYGQKSKIPAPKPSPAAIGKDDPLGIR